MFAYSAKKYRAKSIPEYSVWNPATNSASASAKSYGARLVSARIKIKNMKTKGTNKKTNQLLEYCAITILCKLKLPDTKRTTKNKKPKDNSYDITWEVARKAPTNEYCDRLDHPPNITPYTFNEEIANIKNKPREKSDITTPLKNGIADHKHIDITKENTGAKKNKTPLLLRTKIISLVNSFIPSDMGCSIPQ